MCLSILRFSSFSLYVSLLSISSLSVCRESCRLFLWLSSAFLFPFCFMCPFSVSTPFIYFLFSLCVFLLSVFSLAFLVSLVYVSTPLVLRLSFPLSLLCPFCLFSSLNIFLLSEFPLSVFSLCNFPLSTVFPLCVSSLYVCLLSISSLLVYHNFCLHLCDSFPSFPCLTLLSLFLVLVRED